MKNLKEVEKLLDNYSIDGGDKFSYWVDAIDIADCSDGREATEAMNEKLERAVQESSDIIYYSKAIKFLAENDNSLRESMKIASEMGYNVEDLNSELLASLLNYSQNMEQLSEDLEAFENDFNNLDDEPDEDDEEDD